MDVDSTKYSNPVAYYFLSEKPLLQFTCRFPCGKTFKMTNIFFCGKSADEKKNLWIENFHKVHLQFIKFFWWLRQWCNLSYHQGGPIKTVFWLAEGRILAIQTNQSVPNYRQIKYTWEFITAHRSCQKNSSVKFSQHFSEIKFFFRISTSSIFVKNCDCGHLILLVPKNLYKSLWIHKEIKLIEKVSFWIYWKIFR